MHSSPWPTNQLGNASVKRWRTKSLLVIMSASCLLVAGCQNFHLHRNSTLRPLITSVAFYLDPPYDPFEKTLEDLFIRSDVQVTEDPKALKLYFSHIELESSPVTFDAASRMQLMHLYFRTTVTVKNSRNQLLTPPQVFSADRELTIAIGQTADSTHQQEELLQELYEDVGEQLINFIKVKEITAASKPLTKTRSLG